MSPITPPNACGASPDPSRLAQTSLRAFWSWTPFAPFLGLKSPWLEIWGPQMRAFGALSRAAYASGGAFAEPKAAQVEAQPAAEQPAKVEAEAKPAAKAKPAKAAPADKPAKAAAVKAEVAPVKADEVKAEAPAKVEAAPAEKPARAAAKKPAPEAPKAAKDLFDAPEADPEVTLDAAAEPSLAETFSAAPEAQAEPAAPAPAEAAAPAPAPAPAVEEIKLEAKPAPAAEAVEAPAEDLTRVDGVGPATARRLQEQGVRRYADLAALTPEALIEIRRVGTLTITEEQAREIIASAAVLARPN